MTNRIHRKLVVATAILGFAAALSACGSGGSDTATSNTPTTTTATASATQSAEPATDPTTTASTAAPTATATTTRPTGKPADANTNDDGCPVSENTLLKIVNAKTDGAAAALRNVGCYNGWATGDQVVSKDYVAKHGDVQPSSFLFRYDRSARHWVYDSEGNIELCPASIPAETRKHLPACKY